MSCPDVNANEIHAPYGRHHEMSPYLNPHLNLQPEKTADISLGHHCFPREMTSEKRLMTCYYLDVGIASDWLKQTSLAARPVRSTTQIWVVKRHQYGISALVLQTSFGGEKSGGVANCSSVKHDVLCVLQSSTLMTELILLRLKLLFIWCNMKQP